MDSSWLYYGTFFGGLALFFILFAVYVGIQEAREAKRKQQLK